ncbi:MULTISPECIES: hypothetical protein [Cloacibacterium]|uniref:hypothetical protein n=1 Tax=Cloacibacterium TaxID=501783 RepID=UPI001BCCFF78|nr:hypothetical protein [Cloacibacterium caeni]
MRKSGDLPKTFIINTFGGKVEKSCKKRSSSVVFLYFFSRKLLIAVINFKI